MQPLPYSLDNGRRGIVGMTWVSTRCERQFFIAAPKTVPVAYQHSGCKMQQTYVLFSCEHDVELSSKESRNTRSSTTASIVTGQFSGPSGGLWISGSAATRKANIETTATRIKRPL